MSEDLQNIDDLFKKGLEHHTELPLEDVWINIDRTLDKKKVASISKRYNRLKWAAAAILLFSIGMAMYTLHLHKKNLEVQNENNAFKKAKTHQTHFNKTPGTNYLISKEGNQPSLEKVNGSVSEKNTIVARSPVIAPGNESESKNDLNVQHNSARQPTLDIAKDRLTSSAFNKNNFQKMEKNQEKPGLENAPKIKTKIKPGESNKEEIAKNILPVKPGNNTELPEKNDGHNKPDYSFISSKERGIERIPVLPELNNESTKIPKYEGELIPEILKENRLALKPKANTFSKFSQLKNKSVSRFSITAYFSPDLVATSLKNDNDQYRDQDRDVIRNGEQNSFSYTAGLLTGYKISKSLILETGLTFSSWQTNIHQKTIYARDENNGDVRYQFNCSAGYSYLTVKSLPPPASGDSLRALGGNNTLQYIGVPIVLKYKINKGRFSIIPAVGLSINFLSKGNLQTTLATPAGIQKVSSNVIEGLKPVYFSGSANIGAQYALNKNIALALTPAAGFAISPINKNAPVKTNLYTFGLGGGIIVKF